MAALTWTDLVDPDEPSLRAAVGDALDLDPTTVATLTAPARAGDPRATVRADRDHVLVVLAVPRLDESAREVRFAEVDVLVARDRIVTVRRADEAGVVHEIDEPRRLVEDGRVEEPGLALWQLMDEVAERFLDLVDELDVRVDDLEERLETGHPTGIRRAIGELRGSMLRVRRAIAPLRDATRAILDDRVDIDDGTLFPRDVDLRFSTVYEKLLRATEGLDLARDLLAGVRDYHQAQIANDQNDVMKRLTVIASVLLLPTFIVGLYGQNLHGSPEMGWTWGYWFSWGLIALTTAAQIVWYRRKRWV